MTIENRIVQSNGFCWMEGMLATIPVNDEMLPIRLTAPVAEKWNINGIRDCLPVITDAATIGCLAKLAGIELDLDLCVEALESLDS